ncbi:hypothetical protein C0J08_03665 [Marinomonas sp. CT5]|uniref:polysaccharide deacetylase family protein n=1 Tax=Marinomonas sp. CT5 TaxID=2066133 RepID=UPI001BB0C499|nr:polysaccharide deacetylase family protein [Marinomonas sp. CT5]QUX94563.1 hypothetical protein C0J08_03665 [Marinomonas sp. CT5]
MRNIIKFIILFYFYLLYSLKELLGKERKEPIVRVLILHYVSENELGKLANLVDKLSKDWDFISGEEFSLFKEGKISLKRKSLLITFDDGFLSSKFASDNVLAPRNIKSIFFISPGFIDTFGNDQKTYQFLSKNLRLNNIDASNIPNHFKPMSWDDVRSLYKNGNIVGSHTLYHDKVSLSFQQGELVRDLLESKIRLEKELGGSLVSEFAFPFGNIESICFDSYKQSEEVYLNVYSGFRGENYIGETGIVKRDAIDLSAPSFYTKAYLLGASDVFYKGILRGFLKV